MSEVNRMHREAMRLADEAALARMRGDSDEETALLNLAFEAEREAAMLLVGSIGVEPTRSVLFRSAAALAIDVERFDDAERMANLGLGGGPPEPIKSELYEIVEELSVRRHLALNGVELLANEFQMALWDGHAVGSGVISSREMTDRVRRLEQMAIREIARRRGQPFEEKATLPKELKSEFETFVSAPRRGSFTFTVRIGVSPQLSLFDGASNADLVDAILAVIDTVNSGDEDRLEKMIPEDAYRRNYISQVKQLSPDGKRVKGVGITAARAETIETVTLNARPEQPKVPALPDVHTGSEVGQVRYIRGELRKADGIRKNTVGIVEPGKSKPTTIKVPKGMMNDIVRPFWGEEVVVHVTTTPKGLELVDLWNADE